MHNDITQPTIPSQPAALPETKQIYAAAKRFCEFFTLIAVAPPVLLTVVLLALAILWTMGRPVLVTRERVGKGGRIFRQLRLRTLVEGRDSELAQMTFLGRFLEDSCLAELPQLWNVLLGEMSIVGPSPEPPHKAKFYGERLPNYELRQSVRPGITGYAQVYLGDASTSTLLEYDLYYIRHMDATLDLKILWNNVFPETSRPR